MIRNLFFLAMTVVIALALNTTSFAQEREMVVQPVSAEQVAWLADAQGAPAEVPVFSMGRTPMGTIRVYTNEAVSGGCLSIIRVVVRNGKMQQPADFVQAWCTGPLPVGYELEAAIPPIQSGINRGYPERSVMVSSVFKLQWVGFDGRTSTAEINPIRFAARGYSLVFAQGKKGVESGIRLDFTPGIPEEQFFGYVNGGAIKPRLPDFETGTVTFGEVVEASLYVVQLKNGLCAYQWVQ